MSNYTKWDRKSIIEPKEDNLVYLKPRDLKIEIDYEQVYEMISHLFDFKQLTKNKNFGVKCYKDSVYKGCL